MKFHTLTNPATEPAPSSGSIIEWISQHLEDWRGAVSNLGTRIRNASSDVAYREAVEVELEEKNTCYEISVAIPALSTRELSLDLREEEIFISVSEGHRNMIEAFIDRKTRAAAPVDCTIEMPSRVDHQRVKTTREGDHIIFRLPKAA